MEIIAIEKCLMQRVQNVVKHARFLLNQLKENQCTAEIATNQDQDSKIHSLEF